ncbi:hypothetical protein CK516_12925 [Nostoc sp. 'Peltigera malacea cyanobiont' DB3992]|nr:hypothetical protein CK516_12925 [Nostoc sp. 'Peltigera malacea cyanobiont' DB3992]
MSKKFLGRKSLLVHSILTKRRASKHHKCGIQLPQAQAQRLIEWLQPYKELPYKVLATLSDGEKSIITAMNSSWPDAPHQRCQYGLTKP